MSDSVCVNQGYQYPTAIALREATCQLMQMPDVANDLLLGMFPERFEPNADMIVFQYENVFCGIQQWRGIGNSLPVANIQTSHRECVVMPGYWGEEAYVDEQEMIRRAVRTAPTGCVTPVDVTDLIAKKDQWLLYRQLNLQRKMAAEALLYGLYEAIDPHTGQPLMRQKYNINETVALISWNDYANSAPFIDMQNWKEQYEASTAIKFGCCGKIIMNRRTFNKIVRNTNPANWSFLFGRYCTDCGQTTLERINEQLCAHDLPQIVLYNESYFECTGTPIYTNGLVANARRWFIPDDWVIMVGCSDCGPIGERFYTRNANSCGGIFAGPVSQVVDYCEKPPRRISVMRHWNGGIALSMPRAIVSALVR